MNGIARQRNCLFSHAVKCNGWFFAAERNEFPARRLYCFLKLGQTNLISGSTDFFQNLKGWSVGKKKENKKKSPIFCIDFINKSFL